MTALPRRPRSAPLGTVLFVANNKKVMRGRTNGIWLNILCGVTAVLTFAAAIGMLVTWPQ